MKLFDIQEPEAKLKPSSKPEDETVAIGIDLGTTNSLVAYSKEQVASVFIDEFGEKKIPSIIAFSESNGVLVGNQVKYRREDSHNAYVISSIKRLMGKSVLDTNNILHLQKFIDTKSPDHLLKLKVNDKEITPVEISSKILQQLKSIAEQRLGKKVNKAVITVPAHFDDAQRQATKQAAKLVGLEVLRMINEPTAAALAYGLSKKQEGTYIIYDFGGGTFDLSILKMHKGIFKVLATGGDADLGGDDIDYLIAKKILSKISSKYNFDLSDLKSHACQIKEDLSSRPYTEVKITIEGTDISISFSRNELNELIFPIIQKTINITKDTIKDAEIDLSKVSGIVLVGGTTRIPMIKDQLLEHIDPTIKIYDDINPDEIVAIGAAIQAENLSQGSSNLLLDVTPLSIGLELLGGIVEKIVYRNTTIPISVSKEFTTYEDGQTGINLHIVQGEREMAKDCRSLAKLDVINIPPMKAGTARVKVTFTIDVDGLLTVSAEEQITKTRQTIEILPSYGLTNSDIKEILEESIKHSYDDVKQRLVEESIVRGKQIILQVTNSINEDRDLLSEEDSKLIQAKIEEIKQHIKAKDRHSIDNAVNELDKLTSKFIGYKIEKHINSALRGVNVKDINKLLISEKV